MKMKREALAFALVAFGLGCGREAPAPATDEAPAEWGVSAEVDATEVQVGEALTLTLTVRHPAEGDFVPPPETAFEPFTVIGLSDEEPSPFESRLVYRLAAHRLPGELEIPSLVVRNRGEDGEIRELRTEPIAIRVATSLTPDVTDIHEIKEPVPVFLPRDWTMLGWLLAALVGALVAYLLYRKLRREPEATPAWTPPPPPPEVEALDALRRLEEKRLLESGQVEPFHAELAEIAKRYAGRRYAVPYLERTTDEILRDLKAGGLGTGPGVDLRAVLDGCDLVKFARVVPDPDEARRALSMTRRFVERTRPAPEPPSQTLEATA